MLTKPGIFASGEAWDAYNAEQSKMFSNATNDVANNRAAGDAAIAGSVGAANSGVGAAQSAATNALAAQSANASQVRMINSDAEGVRAQAGAVSGIAGGMAQDSAALRGDAATLRGNAGDMWGQSRGWFDTGNDMLNLNPNATGMSGEFNKYYNSLSPENLVSFAASDAQKSVNNTRGQLVRTLSGMGVSPGSAAFGAALAKTRQYEAALLAGVKTRARLLGIDKQGSALAQGMQMAISATGVGTSLANSAINATQGAASATGQAAGVETQRGNLEATAGQLRQGAGNLSATAAGITTGSANAVTSAQSAVTGAYDSVARAQQTAADYYSTQASSVLGLLQSGNSLGMQALFT